MLLALALTLALALGLAGCTGTLGQEAADVPSEVVAAGEKIAKVVLGTEDIAAVELSYGEPWRGNGDNPPADGESPWEITVTAQLAPGLLNREAVNAATSAAMAAVHGDGRYRWTVRMEDNEKDAAAIVFRAAAPGTAAVAGAIRGQYIADARNYRAFPGVRTVSLDAAGAVTATVADFGQLGALVAAMQSEPVSNLQVAAPQGNARFSLGNGWLAEDFLTLLTSLASNHPLAALSVGESARPGERMLELHVSSQASAAAVEKEIKAATLQYTGGQTLVRDFLISYGDPQEAGGVGTRLPLAGRLSYLPELTDPNKNPAPAATFTPPAYVTSPACTPDQLTAEPLGRVEAALGHRSMTVAVSNTGAGTCSLNGYPEVKFQDVDGGALPVSVEHGGSYMFADPGPEPISLAPGGTAWAMLHWRANSTSQGSVLPAFMEVAPGAGTGFTPRAALADIPDIIAGSELDVSAWSWPNAAAFG